MRSNYFYNLLICCLVFSITTVSAQTTSGTNQANAVVNFTQLAQYYAAHPQPLVRKNLPEPDDEGRPSHRPPVNPALIHGRATLPSNTQAPVRLAQLPASPAPLDSFESTLSDGTAIPPDTHGAADSSYLVTTENTSVHIQNRSGGNISQVSLDQFWNAVLPTNTTGSFDPRIQYDQYTGRWIMVALCDGQNANASILIGMSQTNNPTGNWNLFRVLVDATGTNWLDFPNVGFNKKWVVVSGNLFSNAGGNFGGASVYCFNKANIMSNTNANHTIIAQTNSFSICPAFIYDANEPNMWAIESWDGTQALLQLWKITGAVGSEVMTSVGFPAGTTNWWGASNTVTGTQGADFAPQVGTAQKIQTNDDRMNNVTFRNGKLWCSHIAFFPYNPSANATRASAQWWQVDTLANVLQVGAIDDPTNASFYAFPSISVNKYDDALIGFTHFSTTIHPSASYALHLHTDPIDSMRPYHTFRPGQSTYFQNFGSGDDRWGDYSATMFDPVNETDFWTIQEVSAPTANVWDTWWAHVVLCTAPSAPTSVTKPTTHCPNTVGTYTVPAVTGATTYTWSITGTGWSGTSTTNTINLTAGTVSATISVSAVSSCGLSSAPYTFTVTPSTAPAAPSSVTLPTAPCPTATAIYTVPAVTGATSYTWSVSGAGWSGTSTTNTATLTAGTVAGTVSVTASNACGSSSAYTFTAPLSTGPAAPTSVTLPTAPCPNATAIYSVPAVTGATSYTWSVSGTGWSGTSTTNTATLTAGSVSGSVSVTANNACGSSSAYTFTAPISSVPAAPTSVTLPAAPCPNATAVYTVPAVTGATSYTWTVTGTGWSGTSTTVSATLTAGSVTGSVTVKANNACGSSTGYVFSAPISAVPVAPSNVTLPTAPCTNAIATYSVPAVTGATSYTWSVSGAGWSGTSTTTSATLTAGSVAGSVTVTANNACGSSAPYVFSAPHASGPAAPTSVTLPATPCQNATAVYTIPAVTGATSYTWSVSGAGWSGTSTTVSATLTAGSVSGSVSVTANNACGSSAAYVFTAPSTPLPTAPTSVTMPTAPCANAQAVYTVPAVTGATSYTWSVSGTGWSGSSTTNSITLTAGSGSGSVSVTSSNSCGTSTAYTFTAPISTTPTAPTSVTLPTAPCPNATAIYTVPAVTGATSYTWSVSGTGWSGTSTTNSATLTAGSVSGSVSVTASNACGSSAAYTFTAPISAGPTAPTSVTMPTAPCTGSPATYTVPTVAGATSYTWSVSGTGWSGSSTTNSITLTAGNSTASVSVTANNACGSSAPYVFSAPHATGPAAPTSVTLPATPCQNATAVYSVPAVTGATSYTWSVSGTGWSGTSTTNTISLTAGSVTGNVSVTANNACGSSTAYVFTAPMNPLPAAPTSVTLPATPCQNATAVYTVPAVTGATSYTWTVSGTGWSGTSTTNSITLTAGSVSGSITVKANNACGSSTAYAFTAPSNTTPSAPTSVNLPASNCAGSGAVYSVPAVTGATSYTWSVSGAGWSGSSTTNSITLTAGSGSGSVSVTANNSCGSSSAYVFVVNPSSSPATAPQIGAVSAPCPGNVATYSVTPLSGATSYLWQISGTGWSGSSTSTSISVTAGTSTGVIICRGQNACGVGPADTINVTPGSLPGPATIITAPKSICANDTATFSTPAINGATSYVWTVSSIGWSGTSTGTSIMVTSGNGTGTISVAGQNACGIGTAYTLNNILVVPAPSASFSLNTHTIHVNFGVTLNYTGGSSAAATYVWNFGTNGTATPGNGQGPQTIVWTTTGMKYITLEVITSGCTATYTDSVLVTAANGIVDVDIQNMNINIVPNPNDGSFEIQFGDMLTKPVSVLLTDLEGRLVYSNQFAAANSTSIAIDGRQFPSGVYIATINCNGMMVNKKVVINK